jgi:hypothetical protein
MPSQSNSIVLKSETARALVSRRGLALMEEGMRDEG